MSDATNRLLGDPRWPDGMTTQQALTLYVYIPALSALCFGILRAALPEDISQIFAVVAWMIVFIPTWISYELCTQLTTHIFRRSFKKAQKMPLWVIIILGAFIASILIKPYLIWVSEELMGITIPRASKEFPDFILRLPLDVFVFVALWLIVNLIALHQFGITRFGYTKKSNATSETQQQNTPAWLAPYLSKGLLAIEAEDHYVHIYTRQGKSLERHRFSDVIAALGQANGLCVHRSWWVCADAVASHSR